MRLGLLVAVATVVALTGCGGGGDASTEASPSDTGASTEASPSDTDTDAATGSADQSVCRADATAAAEPYSDAFPTAWRFPDQTTAYHVEERAGTGTIVTAISSLPFADILDFLNHDEVDAGFKITDGETEEHDAEANWTAGDVNGRWTIRESADCPGETVIQVFAESTSS